MQYTKKVHAYRLKQMMKREKIRSSCPAARNFDCHSDCDDLWSTCTKEICRICREFVGLNKNVNNCPCFVFGENEAIKLSNEALNKFYNKEK